MPVRPTNNTQKVLETRLELDPADDSGTPIALIELARRSGRLRILTSVDAEQILVEFPFGAVVRRQTGCSRFVRLRDLSYALILGPRPVETGQEAAKPDLREIARAA